MVRFTSCLEKGFFAALFDLFEGFETVAYEGGTNHQQFPGTFLRHLLQAYIGKGFQPAFAQARLERYAVFFLRYAQCFRYQAGGGDHLVPVTISMCRRWSIAAILLLQAMASRNIRFDHMPAGYTVVTEQDMVVFFFQVRAYAFCQ